MSTYRYIATDVLTGRVLMPDIPLVVQSMTRSICGIGQLTGYLSLSDYPAPATAAWMAALIPDQTMIWVLQYGFPIWCGLFCDSQHRSIDSHQYPITAYTPEAILQWRLISGAASFTNMDVFDIARALVSYAVNPARGQNAQIAGLVLGTGESGYLDTLTLGVSNSLQAGGNVYSGTYADEQPVWDALTTLAAADGVEFTFAPQQVGGVFQIALMLGRPAIGQYNTPRIQLSFPGQVLDYARPVMRSQAANYIIGTAAANGTGTTYTSQPPHGVDSNDLGQGNILRQTAVTWAGVGATSQTQINGYVDTLISKYTAGTMVPTIVLGGGQQPGLNEIGLGDAIRFAATSDLDPPGPGGAPGLQLTARVTGWSLQPPASRQPEKLTLTLGALVGSTAIGGVGIP